MQTDIQIAQQAQIKHINQIAHKLDISEDVIEMYGKYKAKLPLNLIDEIKIKQSNLILVTAINPTPAGEGKTTVSVGLTDGLQAIGKKAIAVLREPSLGPVFGLKGGATGGGFSQVIPMEDINLHFTGDFSAIEKANNLLAALIDNNLQNKSRNLGIDPRTIVWKRVMDTNDRSLRKIVIGLGGSVNGVPREDGFNITPASEIMAILCMSKNFTDLRKKLDNIYIGQTFEGKPIFAKDLNATGALLALLKDAIKPNLVQTLEGNPAILHGGPFANIAQGTNSILATKMGLSLADYVITEAGFGADLGAEKFFNIKCTAGNLNPKAVVIVVTIRALRHHGGAHKESLNLPATEYVKKGLKNLAKHIENMQQFGLKPIVAINLFPNDLQEEIALVKELCKSYDTIAVEANGFAEGSKGMKTLAQAVVAQIENHPSKFEPLYQTNATPEYKIETIAKKIYGASEVIYSVKSLKQLKQIKAIGLDHLPICIAKTPKSLSENEALVGRPEGFTLNIREIEIASGAGFLIPIVGEIMRMPGLPTISNAENIYCDDDGKISGLS